jgi:hypothetical protein
MPNAKWACHIGFDNPNSKCILMLQLPLFLDHEQDFYSFFFKKSLAILFVHFNELETMEKKKGGGTSSNNSCKFQTFGNDPLRCLDHKDKIHWRM